MVPLTVNFTAASAPGLGLAVGARGATEGLAVDSPQGADTAPGAANGDPGLTLLEKARGESGSEEGRAHGLNGFAGPGWRQSQATCSLLSLYTF